MENTSENSLVVQANRLIEASYKLKPSQQRFLRVMASMIRKDDEDFKIYEFRIADLLTLFDLKDQSKYSEIPKQTKELMGNVLELKDEKIITQVPFLSLCQYELGLGVLRVQFHPILKPFYINLNKSIPYTKYQLKNILRLRSTYSIRIYELLKQYEKIKTRTFTLTDLKTILKIGEEEYQKYNDFKRFVLLQAQKEINTKTDIYIEFEELKIGRKIDKLKFSIIKNRSCDKIANENSEIGKIEISSNKPLEEYEVKACNVITIMNRHDINLIEAQKIYEAANGNIEIINKCYQYCLSKNINNIVGYMIELVKPNVFQEPQNNKVKNKFLNFPQTKYNFDEIEQLEMKRTIEKLKKEGILNE